MDVTGIADGVYILETVADPDNGLLEANEANNCGGVFVRLSDMGSAPRAEILGNAPACTQ
jgi:subtilase family serine protease